MLNSYTFGLIALVLWGIAPIFGKLGLTNLDPLPALMIRSAMVTAMLFAAVLLAGKWSAVSSASPRDIMYILIEGLCAALLGQLAYFYAIKLGDVSKAALLVAGAPIITLIAAVLMLGEKITIFKIVGMAAVVGGIVLLRL